MKIFTKPKTDEEYIEIIRRSYNKRWITFWVIALISLIIFGSTFYFINTIDNEHRHLIKSIASVTNPDATISEKQLNDIFYFNGLKVGFILTGGLYLGTFGFIFALESILSKRKHYLLLKYYDKNKGS